MLYEIMANLLSGDCVNSGHCYVTHATIEELCFLRGSCRRAINGTNLELSSVVRRWPAGKDVSAEARISVVRCRYQETTLQAGEDLVIAAVTCKVYRLAMALQLLVAPSRVLKW
jgi:hypothetical protein